VPGVPAEPSCLPSGPCRGLRWHKLQRKEADEKAVRDVMASEAKTEDAVLQGLSDARSRVQDSPTSSSQAEAASPPNGSSTPGHSEDDPAASSQQAGGGTDAQEDDTGRQRKGREEAALGSSSSGSDQAG
jgi:hypothetical protein